MAGDMNMISKASKTVQEVGDVCGVSVTCIAFFGWVPKVTAVLAMVWFILRIWESDTVRELTGRIEDSK
tara:strand:- start:724 stop:930 length:207 start_codon:yes stop_codon:yes gene_type:complete